MAITTQPAYTAASPYYTTNIVSNKYLGLMNNRPIPMNPSDAYMILPMVYEYRPDLLAYDLYNDSQLWWVFAQRNPNVLGPDPYFNFTAGTGIYIPTLATLKAALGI